MMRGAAFAAIAGCLLLSTVQTQAKIFTHCELAQELRRLSIPESQIATWVCIAHYESTLNTSAISGTGDHGIFQISEEYWCSPPGRGKGCALSCRELEDDNIADDVECVQTIFDEHQGLSGNGFNAWAVYPRCKNPSNVNRFIKKCTAGSIDNSIDSSDTPLDLRFGIPVYSSPPQSSYFRKSSYRPSHDFSFAKTSASPFRQDYRFKSNYNAYQDASAAKVSASPVYKDYSLKSVYSPSQGISSTRTSASPVYQDYSFQSVYSPVQDIGSSTASVSPLNQDYSLFKSIYSPSQEHSFTRTSVSPIRQDYTFKSAYSPSQEVTFTRASYSPVSHGYDFSGRYDPSSYTKTRPTPIIVSSTAAPAVAYSPSIYSSSRPSSYSVGSIYYNPFETKSTTASPAVYAFSPRKSFSTSIFDNNRRTVFGYSSTPAPQVYQSYTKSDSAVLSSSPAPPLRKFKAAWEGFPWWNGGK